MMRRIMRMLADLAHREPITHAICYVEPDGTREVDFKQAECRAIQWAEWCKRDGCADVQVHPLYTQREISLARYRSVQPA